MNTRFSTYASYWIKQSMKRAVINTGKTIRVPAYTVDLLNKWRRATAQLQEEMGLTSEEEGEEDCDVLHERNRIASDGGTPSRRPPGRRRYFLMGMRGAVSTGIMIAARRPFWIGSFV